MTGIAKTQRWTRSIVNGLRLRHRLLLAASIALVVLAILPRSLGVGLQAAIAWNVGGLIYLAFAFKLMSSCDASHIRERARIEDEARFVFFAILLLAILSSFFAVFALIADAKGLAGLDRSVHVGLAALTVLVSWLLMQVVFTLHYAHDYFGEGVGPGLVFPGDQEPDYWDFFYFTTSIGATSQTSDVAITSKTVRRLVAFHAVLSFVFNTTVVALAINLASSLI